MDALIFNSVEQMTSVVGLRAIIGEAVTVVKRSPLPVAHHSGNTLERVIARRRGMERRFVLKRFSIERDWIMRLTHDDAVRELALFRHGIYTRLPDTCYVPIIAAARDGSSWASLMADVTDGLAPADDAPIAAADLRRYLAQLAAVHARFLHDDSLLDPALGLSTVRDFALILSPRLVRDECAEGRGHAVLEAAQRGWRVFDEIAPPEVVQAIEHLERAPDPLLALIDHMPHTLVHGDFKTANLGAWPPVVPGEPASTHRTIILDWQDATYGPPLLDLGYFLAISALRLPVTKEAAIQMYRDALTACGYRYPQQTWQRDLDLGLLTGGALRLLWQKALGTQAQDPKLRQRQREEVRWWSTVVLRAGRWLT
ncbi:MAG TPA: phosphotransferase [Herpetosiphonaceae bacterium]